MHEKVGRKPIKGEFELGCINNYSLRDLWLYPLTSYSSQGSDFEDDLSLLQLVGVC